MVNLSIKSLLVPVAAAALVACGGGGGSADGNRLPSNSIAGVAAVGAPLSGAVITLTDARGVVKTTTADDQGNFSFADIAGMQGPFQISAVLNLGERTVSHYALVAAVNGAQTVNVTQLTSAMTALLGDSGVLAGMSSQQLAALRPQDIEQAKQKILSTIQPLTEKIVSAGFDPVTTPFVANGTGVDLLLDHLDLTVRVDTVNLVNKMAVPDANGMAVGAIGVVPKSGEPSPIQNDSTTSTAGFEQLQQALERCFAVPVDERVRVNSSNSATLHSACASIAEDGYLHNGQTFALRWMRALKFDKFNSNTPSSSDTWRKTKFMRPEVRLRVSSNPDEIIAVNIHFNDTDGNNYTTPELIRKTPQGWKLYGNQRAVNAFAEAQLNYYQDLSKSPAGANYNNINFSRVDSGFRFFVDPRTAFDSNGVPDYSYVIDFETSTGYRPNNVANYAAVKAQALEAGKSVLKCVVVTGPGRMVGNKWMGVYPHGLVMKVPFSSPTQDYVAIDRRMTLNEKSQLDAQMEQPFAQRTALPSICGTGTTLTSSPNYTVDIEALTNQVHPFTGQVDTAINGRDVKWNTGPRYARIAPDTDLAKTFDNNPVFHFYLIDTNDKPIQKISTRMLGELPPASMAAEIMRRNMASQMDVQTLRRYLDFEQSGADVRNVTGVNAQWTTAPNAFGADLVGFYSEVQKAKTGNGLRSSSNQSRNSASNDPGNGTVVPASEVGFTLWDTDPELASDLDLIDGTNFYWRWSEIARSRTNPSLPCNAGANAPASNSLVTSQSVGVARSVRQLNTTLTSTYLGTDALQAACLDWYTPSRPADKAYLHREVWMRTYTDKNVRFYSYTANKAFR